ncbi:D-xylulose kinase [Amanita muscaria]
MLLMKLAGHQDLARIRAIGGSAQHALVWWKSTVVPSLSSLDPHLPLHSHFTSHNFSLPNTPTAQDTSSHTHALAIEALLGGPDHMSSRVGTCASASLVAAQLLRVRETWPQEVWARTGRLQLASAFICSLISGKWQGITESEASATGMWIHSANNSSGGTGQGHWDETVLDIVGGSREDGRRVRGWLGEVDVSGGNRRVGNVSRYLVERYGFDPDTIVAPFTSDFLATYLSLCPSANDAVISFGPMDILMTPAHHYTPTRLYNIFLHPVQEAGEKRRYIAAFSSRNADVPRALVRDMYTKSWSAFDRLVAIVPPGGSIGLDDKLFSFWHLQSDSYPYSHVKGIYRFETGIKVNEFRDLRANPRCLLESQIISFRTKWSRMLATGVLGAPRKPGGLSQTPPIVAGASRPPNSIPPSFGLTFDPYDHVPLPSRVIATGAAANFPSIANLVGDVFNAAVFVPSTQIDSAQIAPHRNAPAQGFPGRAALGGSFVARWVWGKECGIHGLAVFEDEMKRLLGKRWVSTGGVPLRTNINGGLPSGGNGGRGGSSAGNSGTSTPFGHRGGLGATIFREEDEDEERLQGLHGLSGFGYGPPGLIGSNSGGGSAYGPYDSRSSLGPSGLTSRLSSAYMGSDSLLAPPPQATGGGANGNGNGNGNGASTSGGNTNGGPTTPTPLAPVVALPTGDAESQLGLAKVAEPDLDAFLAYASIVPEYCRLETLLIKAIV